MSYRMSDSVAMRMVQIFQEALLMGVDGADLMRQVRLVVDPDDSTVVTLDPQYESQVADSHRKYLEEAEKLKATRAAEQTVFVFEK